MKKCDIIDVNKCNLQPVPNSYIDFYAAVVLRKNAARLKWTMCQNFTMTLLRHVASLYYAMLSYKTRYLLDQNSEHSQSLDRTFQRPCQKIVWWSLPLKIENSIYTICLLRNFVNISQITPM